MYYQPADSSLEEQREEEKQQRDADTYASLKQAIQNRFFDVLFNWDLFAKAFHFCFLG